MKTGEKLSQGRNSWGHFLNKEAAWIALPCVLIVTWFINIKNIRNFIIFNEHKFPDLKKKKKSQQLAQQLKYQIRCNNPTAWWPLNHSVIIVIFGHRHLFNLIWKYNGAYCGAMKKQCSSMYFYHVHLKEKPSPIKLRGKGFSESKATLKSVTLHYQVCSIHPQGC